MINQMLLIWFELRIQNYSTSQGKFTVLTSVFLKSSLLTSKCVFLAEVSFTVGMEVWGEGVVSAQCIHSFRDPRSFHCVSGLTSLQGLVFLSYQQWIGNEKNHGDLYRILRWFTLLPQKCHCVSKKKETVWWIHSILFHKHFLRKHSNSQFLLIKTESCHLLIYII